MGIQNPQAALSEECQKIHDDANVSANAQYLSAKRYERIAFWFQVIPAIASALIGTLAVGLSTLAYLRWMAAASAVVTAVATILNPAQRFHAHLSAGKAFTVVKNEARSTGSVFGPLLPLQEFQRLVLGLVTRYNDLIRLVPQSEAWAIRLVVSERTKKRNEDSSAIENGH